MFVDGTDIELFSRLCPKPIGNGDRGVCLFFNWEITVICV
jgi:hypothetical protein